MKTLEEYAAIAREAARRAGSFLIENYGSVKEWTCKEEGHYMSEIDKQCNDLYEDFLRRETPEAALYTEEGEQVLESELVWAVDPIDGSTNYRIGLPLFVTQICLLHKGEPVVAVVNSPILKMEYTAQKGGGSFLNGKRIAVNGLAELKKILLMVDKGHATAADAGDVLKLFGRQVHTARMWGSVGFELAALAAGKINALVGLKMSAFDYAPGALLIREAGGGVMNFSGSDWAAKDIDLVASNHDLLPFFLAKLKGWNYDNARIP
ncbi:MAG: inositol monophosphatase [Candidatus Pacebacteria bacterium]|jgi:myo-inositol-1(or 4)-monophosphatase|nr:inositol monophosphatase [Candidatus Paceibacterota bacterium]